ncbi:MAG: tetratricopeptide repeat protein, partial [Spirochaetota bacterium]
MNSRNLLIGITCIISGIALFAAYDQLIKPEREAREILTEGKMIMERGDRESLNLAVTHYTRIITRYPRTKSVPEAYSLMGDAYEKLGLYRLAYLRYSYLMKAPLVSKITPQMKTDTITRLARLKIMRNYKEEGISQLYTLLNNTQNAELRSRIYSELGQAYLRNGDLSKARSSFDIAVQEYGSNEEAILGKARVAVRSGEYDSAFALYDYFLKYFGAVSPYTADVKKAYLQQLYHAGTASFRAGSYSRCIDLMARFNRNF